MRKLKKTEKFIIAMADSDYITYDCQEHGIFQLHVNKNDGKCPYTCNSKVSLVEDVDTLKEQFKKELDL